MFKTALRNVLAHKARLLMTVLAVMLGVAFVSGTLVFTDTLKSAFKNQSAKSYDNVAVAVESFGSRDDDKQDPGIGKQTLRRIEALDGVTSVNGRVDGFAGVADKKGKLIGQGWANKGGNYSPGKDGKDPAYTFTQGSGPVRDADIALDKDTASKGGYQVGDRIRVATNGPVKTYTLSGVFTTEDGGVNAGGSLVLFDTKVAQQLYLKPGFFQKVNVSAKPGTDAQKLLDQVLPTLPEHATARTGQALAAQEADDIEEGLSALSQTLLAFAAIALFVGIFLISNTFTMLVAQRTKELALMRAVGASRAQVRRSVLTEALVVGTVASAVGFGLGLGLAVGLRSAMDSFGVKLPAGSLIVSSTPVIAALAVGVIVTLIAALLPAWRAAKIPPVAAMNSVHAAATTKSLVVRNTIGAIIALGGFGAILAGAGAGRDGKTMIGFGAFLALVGIIVLIPLLSRPVIGAVRPLLARAFGVSGKLASQNAVRNPRRTGATASALAIGLTLVTALSVLGITVGKAVDKTTTDNIKADYMVAMASGERLDKSVVPELRKAPGVVAASPKQASYLKVDGDFRSVTGVTPGDIEKVLNVEAVSGSLATLGKGQLAIDDETAEKQGWKPGTRLPVEFDDKKKTSLTVGAVFKKQEFLDPVLAATSVLDPHESRPHIESVFVKMSGGATKANEQALVNALGDNPAISFMDQQDIRDTFGGMINTLLNIMYGLLAMALLIAVLGVINTLAMSVFERQQEIGMLRAIGLDRSRVKRMIRLEAVVISVFGAVIGTGLGTFLAWAIGETIKGSIPAYALVIPWDRIALFLALAGLVGVLAAMWPARSAARLNMLTAIKTE
ncbi:ABC transporter permease [Streptomyces sp. TLI_146]|uniref:ABC transporter permease n=1 Tax=Streptomyces sp. TLI_146 TaxID=1938858 RepID=UPI000C70B0E7|nr:ABC transporter permease [Streptomyces sp. TLI_146]PKV86141.1 putative ABC transport system permease protein [Streptomyces sp. TLI_146]